ASEGEAALIDPQRDVGRLLAAAEARGARVTWVLDTHVHNDYVSGALEARAASGARIAMPARGGYEFPHVGLEDGRELGVGSLRASSVPSGERASTIDAELGHNPSFAAPDVDAFLALQLGGTGLPAFPAYYRHMAPINRAGPRVLGRMWPRPGPVTPARLAE